MSILDKIICVTTVFTLGSAIGRILVINSVGSDSIIRKKWIQLSKDHHPDSLIDKILPQELIDQSNEEFSSINFEYDEIKNQSDIL